MALRVEHILNTRSPSLVTITAWSREWWIESWAVLGIDPSPTNKNLWPGCQTWMPRGRDRNRVGREVSGRNNRDPWSLFYRGLLMSQGDLPKRTCQRDHSHRPVLITGWECRWREAWFETQDKAKSWTAYGILQVKSAFWVNIAHLWTCSVYSFLVWDSDSIYPSPDSCAQLPSPGYSALPVSTSFWHQVSTLLLV